MRVQIIDGTLIISLPLENIPAIVDGACSSGVMEKRIKVIDATQFGSCLLHSLEKEDESGLTVIHRMFDAAIIDAIEHGADGIAYPMR